MENGGNQQADVDCNQPNNSENTCDKDHDITNFAQPLLLLCLFVYSFDRIHLFCVDGSVVKNHHICR
jgi:hypothetical protein